MKVLEIEPIIKPVNGDLTYSSRGVPPRPNGSISKVSFLQGRGFFVLITKDFVSIMEL
jgi:hypothetical protein